LKLLDERCLHNLISVRYTTNNPKRHKYAPHSITQQQQQQQPFYGPLSRTTLVSWYQKKHSPTHHP